MGVVSELLAAHLEQYLRTSLTAAARAAGARARDAASACRHDFALTLEWATRRRLLAAEVLAWARGTGAACDHELMESLALAPHPAG